MKNRKLLIDADLLVHRSTVVCENDVSFDERYHILWSDADNAWNILLDTLHDLLELSNTSDAVFIFSDPKNNFRKSLGTGNYKSNRASSRKPLAYWDVVDRCKEQFEHDTAPNIEADDLLGIKMSEAPDDYILWSLDKDLKQVAGLHLQDDEVVRISEEQAEDFFWYQVLAGDKVDGYDGCQGIGMETAKKIVHSGQKVLPYLHTFKSGTRKDQTETRWKQVPCDNIFEVAQSYYYKAGMSTTELLYNAQMANILNNNEYKDNKPILWMP